MYYYKSYKWNLNLADSARSVRFGELANCKYKA